MVAREVRPSLTKRLRPLAGALPAPTAQKKIRSEQRQNAQSDRQNGVYYDKQKALPMLGSHVHSVVVHDVPEGQCGEQN